MTDFNEILSRVASDGRTQAFNIHAYASLDNCYTVELISNIRASNGTEHRDMVEHYLTTINKFVRLPIIVLLHYRDS